MRARNAVRIGLLGALLSVEMGAQPAKSTMQFPDAPRRDTVQKVCGTCHGADVVVAKGMTRPAWGQVIASMVTRGAKGTDQEFAVVLDYLSKNFPPNSSRPAAGPATAARRPSGFGVGSDDKHVVDPTSADRGRSIYASECVTCHGPKARGKEGVPDLVRSLTVLHDRYGDTIGPFMKKGHKMQSGTTSANMTQAQIGDLSNFLHQKVDDVLRSGPNNHVLNVLTGDAKAGETYFNGEGKCKNCHSPKADLAGISKRFDPPALQQRFLFPQSIGFGRGGGQAKSKPVMVTVTPTGGAAVSGTLLSLDDFNVSLRDSAGEYHSWKRTQDLKVDKKDPYSGHVELLELYTDKNIHDLVAYLVTLQ